ncbi:MAG TPA: hypothetical protein VNM68_06505, partial [Candidatus Polarisedimenticolia bacterium]|nr:hypothetical protein [Candidatus Polarisedimenticolia bacterium]
MQASRQYRLFVFVAILLGSVACWLPAPAFAGGLARRAPAPRPDVERKVYTNDDLGWPATTPAAASAAPAVATPMAPPTAGGSTGASAASAA